MWYLKKFHHMWNLNNQILYALKKLFLTLFSCLIIFQLFAKWDVRSRQATIITGMPLPWFYCDVQDGNDQFLHMEGKYNIVLTPSSRSILYSGVIYLTCEVAIRKNSEANVSVSEERNNILNIDITGITTAASKLKRSEGDGTKHIRKDEIADIEEVNFVNALHGIMYREMNTAFSYNTPYAGNGTSITTSKSFDEDNLKKDRTPASNSYFCHVYLLLTLTVASRFILSS
jgi:hypothetical protein